MKTLNEQIDLKLASLRRQLEATRRQITALQAYRDATRRATPTIKSAIRNPKSAIKK
jgi:hypothetical protein